MQMCGVLLLLEWGQSRGYLLALGHLINGNYKCKDANHAKEGTNMIRT